MTAVCAYDRGVMEGVAWLVGGLARVAFKVSSVADWAGSS